MENGKDSSTAHIVSVGSDYNGMHNGGEIGIVNFTVGFGAGPKFDKFGAKPERIPSGNG